MADSDKIDILLVDDLPENLLVLESVLAELDENVITTRSGSEALRRVLERDFAVILLDINMPGMDGFETAALIRGRKKSAHTPIIFLTAYADAMHTARGYSLGAVDFILTPIVPEVLSTKVKVFVDLFRMARQVERQAEERVALAREQAARAAAEEATRRSTFLAGASKVLSASLDPEAIARGLLHLVMPMLSDLSVLNLVSDNGQPLSIQVTYADYASGRRTRALAEGEGLHPTLAESVRRVFDSGEPESLNFPPSAMRHPISASKTAMPSDPGETPEEGPDFELRSALVLPLTARGKVLGVLTLATGPSERSYSEADRDLATDLAGRIAIALINARLHRDIQESDRRKNEFLAMLAHELRNPMAPIRNACQILRLGDLVQPELCQARDMIDRQVQHMVRLVDDLLDISRITRNKIQLKTRPVDVAAVVARAVEISKPLLDARRHKLTVTVPRERLLVNADVVRLEQVLANLLNNAAKYTGEGGRVEIVAEREGRQAIFRVRDTGVGIAPDMLASIFDLFTQAERSLDRSQGGLGIGLTLVRRLVELHGGTVQAFSAGANQGSEFVVRLPALHGALAEAAANGDDHRVGQIPPRRVLVVDDNVDAARSLATLLRAQGHEVRVAYNGPAALAEAAALRPEMVLLDIGLPGMDGYEVARRLRHEVGLNDVMLAAVTGYGQDEDRRLSQLAGINIHLVKPVDLETVYTLLARPGELNSETRPISDPAPAASRKTSSPAIP